MAKSKGVEEEVEYLTEKKSEPTITVGKFFYLHSREFHAYTSAYLKESFRGIMKTEAEWSNTLKKYMEGKK